MYFALSYDFKSVALIRKYQVILKLSISDVIVSQKGSNGDGKLHFFGLDKLLDTIFPPPPEHMKNEGICSTVQKGHKTKPE